MNAKCVVLITSPVWAVAKYCDEYVCLSLCLSLCLSVSLCLYVSGTTCVIFTNFLCTLPTSVAQSSSSMLTIGRIAYRWEGGDGSAQCGQTVLYDCLVCIVVNSLIWFALLTTCLVCTTSHCYHKIYWDFVGLIFAGVLEGETAQENNGLFIFRHYW